MKYHLEVLLKTDYCKDLWPIEICNETIQLKIKTCGGL